MANAGYSFRERKNSNAPELVGAHDFGRDRDVLPSAPKIIGNQIFPMKMSSELPGNHSLQDSTYRHMFGSRDLSELNLQLINKVGGQ